MPNYGFIKQSRNPFIDNELLKHPHAFVLLTQIARRTHRGDGPNPKQLAVGEALLGDYRSIGATERRYRTAKNWLEKSGLATFKATNKGTIAKLTSTDIYDLNILMDDEQKAKKRQANDDYQE